MPDQNDNGRGNGSDEVLKALDELETVLRENARASACWRSVLPRSAWPVRTGANGRASSGTRTNPGPCSW